MYKNLVLFIQHNENIGKKFQNFRLVFILKFFFLVS